MKGMKFDSRAGIFLLLACGLAASCDQQGGPSDRDAAASARRELERRLRDPKVDGDERIRRIAAEGRPGNLGAVEPLLRVLKDRSQINFLPRRSADSASGWIAEEFKEVHEKDPNALERTMAVCAVETIGSPVAIPDLVAALGDRSPFVRNHAARALLRFGIRSGVPVLLDNLDGRAQANETANRMLVQISGQDMGFHADTGWKRKSEAAQRWRAWWAGFRTSGKSLRVEGRPYNIKNNAEADARIRFFVDVMGQFQKKYSEEARTFMGRMGVVAIPFLREAVDRARQEGNHALAAAVATVLGDMDDPRCEARVRTDLIDLLAYSGQGTVRARAARSLARHPGPGVSAALGRSLESDRDVEVQVDVLGALGRVGSTEAVDLLEAFDPGPDRDLADARTVALFEAEAGRRNKEQILGWLVAGPVDRRNAAYQVLRRVTGVEVGINPDSTPEDLARFVALFREKLPR